MNIKASQNSPSGRLIRTPADYWSYAPNPLPPDIRWTSDLVTALSDADRALGELAGLGQSLPNPHIFLAHFERFGP